MTGYFALRGRLPGVEPAPYIIRFTEDRPNPLYRRICYTTAWGEAIAFAVLNIVGLVVAIVTGTWMLKEIYRYAYFPLAGTIWLLGALGQLPRVKPSTAGEGHERRYFYGTVWAVAVAQPVLWLLYLTLPRTRADRRRQAGRRSWACSRRWAGWPRAGGCRARGRSCPASWRRSTEAAVARDIDSLTSFTLKHLRDRWWDAAFTEFLRDVLQPQPGERVLDVGCGAGTAELI